MAGLKLKHVYKVYSGGVRAVNDFNLDIKDKSFVVLVGPSGCGKSTTLRMIAGLESITSGQLYIDNVLVNDVESKNRDIAMVFQSYALYPHMTVYQNMGFSLKLRHEKPDVIREKVLKAAEVLEISDLLDRKPKELSGGQRQRVALGRAIVREPNVFLLDEPLSNLDAKLRVQMRTEITKLHEKLQTTFIYVTHDQTEAMTMGDVIVVMNKGFVQQADAPVTLFEDPTNLFVATFLGSPQMNIIESNLIEKDGKIGVVLEGVGENVVWLNDNTAKQIKNSGLDFSKKYLFGIRPDHVSISKKGIPAHVEAVEQLGDETIIYTTIKEHKQHVVVKAPLTIHIASQDDVYLDFNKDRVYLFDKVSEHSLIGMPSFNKLPCTLKDNQIVLGKQKIKLDDEYVSHILARAREEKIFLAVKPEHVELEGNETNCPIKAKVQFIEERTNYNIVYTSLDGVNPFLILRASKDRKFKEGDDIKVYIPLERTYLFNENDDSLYCREIVFENEATAKVSTKNEKTTIKIGKQVLSYPDLKVEDGDYKFTLKQEGAEIVFDKKTAKAVEESIFKKLYGNFGNLKVIDKKGDKVLNFGRKNITCPELGLADGTYEFSLKKDASKTFIEFNKCDGTNKDVPTVNIYDKATETVIKFNNPVIDCGNLDIENGNYLFTLNRDGDQIVLDLKNVNDLEGKVCKSAIPGQSLKVSCYDEEPQHKINTIYAKIDGFDTEEVGSNYKEMQQARISNKNGTTCVRTRGNNLVCKDLGLADGEYMFDLKLNGNQVVFECKTIEGLEEAEYKDVPRIKVVNNDNNAHVEFAHKAATFQELGIPDGDYIFTLNRDGDQIIFDYKIDEGTGKYVTLVTDNIFSVYKMPEFKINITPDNFILKKI